MNNVDRQYLELCAHIMAFGNEKADRTGVGTKSIFGAQMRFDLSEGFPLITTKKVHWHSVVGELLWFLRGDTNIKFLQDNKIKIWDAWATDDGEVGRMYGAQWRGWECYSTSEYGTQFIYTYADQIKALVDRLKRNPDSRRHLVSAWNLADLPSERLSPQDNVDDDCMALAPCHYSFQCYVNDGKLSMLVNQRSCDAFLGLPFNIASYALLTHMLAQVCSYEVGELIWSGGDCHIYNNHFEQIKEQTARYLDGKVYPLPHLELDESITDIDDFSFEHIKLIGYKSGAKISAPVAV